MIDKGKFEDRLLSELRQVSAENPAPAPEARPAKARPYGRFAAVGTGLAAVVAGIAIYTSTGDNTTSAYAVEKQPDGKVSVEITNLTEAAGLEESLAAAGVAAEVNMAPMATVCAVEIDTDKIPEGDWKKTTPSPTTEPDVAKVEVVPAQPAAPAESVKESGRTGIPAGVPGAAPIEIKKADADGASFSIDPKEIPKGETVIIAPSETKPSKLIPAGAPSAAPIAISVSAPGESDC